MERTIEEALKVEYTDKRRGIASMECPYCQEKIYRVPNLRDHLVQKHKNVDLKLFFQYECTQCGKLFLHRAGLKRHLKAAGHGTSVSVTKTTSLSTTESDNDTVVAYHPSPPLPPPPPSSSSLPPPPSSSSLSSSSTTITTTSLSLPLQKTKSAPVVNQNLLENQQLVTVSGADSDSLKIRIKRQDIAYNPLNNRKRFYDPTNEEQTSIPLKRRKLNHQHYNGSNNFTGEALNTWRENTYTSSTLNSDKTTKLDVDVKDTSVTTLEGPSENDENSGDDHLLTDTKDHKIYDSKESDEETEEMVVSDQEKSKIDIKSIKKLYNNEEGCSKCGKLWRGFRDEVAILNHMKAKHTYACNFNQCPRRYTRFQLLVEHRKKTEHYSPRCKNPFLRDAHDCDRRSVIPEVCSKCHEKKNRRRLGEWKRHLKMTHSLPCPYLCGVMFVSHMSRSKHVRLVHENHEMNEGTTIDESTQRITEPIITICDNNEENLSSKRFESVQDIMYDGQLLCPICLKKLKIEDVRLRQQYQEYLRSKQNDRDISNEWMDCRFTDEPIMYGIQESVLKYHVATCHPEFAMKESKNKLLVKNNSSSSSATSTAIATNPNISQPSFIARQKTKLQDNKNDDEEGEGEGDEGEEEVWNNVEMNYYMEEDNESDINEEALIKYLDRNDNHHIQIDTPDKLNNNNNNTFGNKNTISTTPTGLNNNHVNDHPWNTGSLSQNSSNRQHNNNNSVGKCEFFFNKSDRSKLVDFVAKTVERFHNGQENPEGILNDLPKDPAMLLELLRVSYVILDISKKYCESVDRIVTEKIIDMMALCEENTILKQLMEEHLPHLKPQFDERLRESQPYQLYGQRYQANYLNKLKENMSEEEFRLLGSIGSYYQEMYRKELNRMHKQHPPLSPSLYKNIDELQSPSTTTLQSMKNINKHTSCSTPSHTITIHNVSGNSQGIIPSLRNSTQNNNANADTHIHAHSNTYPMSQTQRSHSNFHSVSSPLSATNHNIMPLNSTAVVSHNNSTVLNNSYHTPTTFPDSTFRTSPKRNEYQKMAEGFELINSKIETEKQLLQRYQAAHNQCQTNKLSTNGNSGEREQLNKESQTLLYKINASSNVLESLQKKKINLQKSSLKLQSDPKTNDNHSLSGSVILTFGNNTNGNNKAEGLNFSSMDGHGTTLNITHADSNTSHIIFPSERTFNSNYGANVGTSTATVLSLIPATTNGSNLTQVLPQSQTRAIISNAGNSTSSATESVSMPAFLVPTRPTTIMSSLSRPLNMSNLATTVTTPQTNPPLVIRLGGDGNKNGVVIPFPFVPNVNNSETNNNLSQQDRIRFSNRLIQSPPLPVMEAPVLSTTTTLSSHATSPSANEMNNSIDHMHNLNMQTCDENVGMHSSHSLKIAQELIACRQWVEQLMSDENLAFVRETHYFGDNSNFKKIHDKVCKNEYKSAFYVFHDLQKLWESILTRLANNTSAARFICGEERRLYEKQEEMFGHPLHWTPERVKEWWECNSYPEGDGEKILFAEINGKQLVDIINDPNVFEKTFPNSTSVYDELKAHARQWIQPSGHRKKYML